MIGVNFAGNDGLVNVTILYLKVLVQHNCQHVLTITLTKEGLTIVLHVSIGGVQQGFRRTFVRDEFRKCLLRGG